ncbi:hypothetical protein SAMN04488074_111177 [Lentzea albidocapillata subsp. violacea]|uniref:Uncharacterized protein n=1 Tax=Lentzea albidocapillata subsp. violacea TaxID=128104 RepID=A0A1G9KKX1_9PSEU|nr:hypothetical protein [Lentzea albidocapillata]SDL50371.1 hypothetical protein SAMN04488074_111177 [Lentzea albidocapillata subsp. violacea]
MEPFRLLHPDLVPRRRESLRHAASMLVQMGLDDTVLSASPVHQRLARVVLASSGVIEWTPGYWAKDSGLDEGFGVVRVGGDRGGVFLSGVLIAYLDVLENAARMGTSIPEDSWRTLLWAPTALFDHVLRRPQVGMTVVTPGCGTENLPLERTQAGQRLYLALMQAVRFAVSGVVRAQDDCPLAEDCVTLATACLRAAEVALAFAADVPGHAPQPVVETAEHRYLWQVINEVRAAVPRARFEQFAAALRRLNDVHTACPLLVAGG